MLAVLATILLLGVSINVFAADSVAAENKKTGTTTWQITNPALASGIINTGTANCSAGACFSQAVIEGFASATSVNQGQTIKLFVKSGEPYFIKIYRMGWYGGTGGRDVTPGDLTSPRAPNAQLSDRYCTSGSGYGQYGLIECDWTDPYTLFVPSDWVSGVYLAKLTTEVTDLERYIIFVVRDDGRPSPFLFQLSVTTYQAYNMWGGSNLYGSVSSSAHVDGVVEGPAFKVSFDRPYAQDYGAGEFLTWEYNMVRFLESEGIDVTYGTNVDTHASPLLLRTHKGFLSVGHDEYWSWEMRNNVENARNQGTGLGFFGADSVYWRIRLEPSTRSAPQPDRTIVTYKNSGHDPLQTDSTPSNDYLVTTRWRDNPVPRPEQALVGVQYGRFTPSNPGEYPCLSGNIAITNTSNWPSWLHVKTDLTDSSVLMGLLGYETDAADGVDDPSDPVVPDTAPAGRILLASSQFPSSATPNTPANMAYYKAASGAHVLASGSVFWPWGLDSYHFNNNLYLDSNHARAKNYQSPGGTYEYYCVSGLTAPAVSSGAQQMTRNFLNQVATRSFAISDALVNEPASGTTSATFTVTLFPASSATETVSFVAVDNSAVAGGDYAATSGTLTFNPGTTTQVVNVTVNSDGAAEASEIFHVNLSSPSSGNMIQRAQGIGTIGTVSVSPTTTVPGGTVTVTISGGTSSTDWVSVSPETAWDSQMASWQFVGTSVRPSFLTFTMPTTPGRYNFRLFANGGYTPKLGTSQIVTVAPAPSPGFWIDNATVIRGSGQVTARFTATLSPARAEATTVNFATSNGSALAGTDYTAASGTLTFAPGTRTQTMSVVVADDDDAIAPETFSVALSSASAGTTIQRSEGLGTIKQPPVTANSTTVTAGSTINVTISGGAASNDWVSVSPVTAYDSQMTSWQFMGSSARPSTLTFTMPTTSGTYNFRLFANGSYTKLGTSQTVTVVP
jgi:Calx-beta domain